MSKMPCSITDDPLNDYSHYCDGTGPYKRVSYLRETEMCSGCGLIVSSVDSETELCSECNWEYNQEQFYKYAADQEWGTEI